MSGWNFRLCLLALCLSLLVLPAFPQDKLEIFGYYEPQYMGTTISRDARHDRH